MENQDNSQGGGSTPTKKPAQTFDSPEPTNKQGLTEESQQNSALQPDNPEARESEEKTLSQFMKETEREEKLKEQLLDNRNLKRCRYEDGYIYQQVYSCITCYQDQIRNLPDEQRLEIERGLPNNSELVRFLKPNGFCIGCMYNCHEGHDVIELYSKLDFRCDCGNGRMPFSCKLLNEKLDYENEKNVYNQNYFDSYCYCKKPHNPELIESFMIQCYQCEDWFHNHHLSPKLTEQVDDNYFLLCKTCVEQMFSKTITLYQGHFHDISLDHIHSQHNPEEQGSKSSLEPSSKRLKLAEGIIPQDCQSQEQCLTFQPFDILFNEQVTKFICKCEQCQKVYAKLIKHVQAENNMSEEDKRLQKNLDGIVDGEDSSEEEKKHENSSSSSVKQSPQKAALDRLTDESYLVGMMAKSMRQSNISHEGQIFIAENIVKFKEYFVSFLRKFDSGSNKITTKDVEEFQKGLEEMKNQWRQDLQQ